MAKKTQSSTMTTAYGARFSQEDLTTPNENVVNQPLKTPEYKEGGIDLVVSLARGRNVRLSGGGNSKKQPRNESMVA